MAFQHLLCFIKSMLRRNAFVIMAKGGTKRHVKQVLGNGQALEPLELFPPPLRCGGARYTTVPDVHEQMFRSGGQSDAKPSVLSSQASLVLIYRPTEEMKV
ncbi:hypothetical protein TNCV_3181121 [Trichonephila clavipes]|nr:hypothetical protein TNCV_3181121 [Trichonephila clavipes]